MTKTTDELVPATTEKAAAESKTAVPPEKEAGKPDNVISLASHRGTPKGKKWDGFKTKTAAREADTSSRPAAQSPQTSPLEAQFAQWIDVDLLDDNPYQPREDYDPVKMAELVNEINRDGQTQAALARPHPTRKGRFQLVAGHRRKYSVLNGTIVKNTAGETLIYANAGAKEAKPEQYRGKLLVVVRQDVSELDMRRIAFKENHVRVDLKPIENAKFYNAMREALSTQDGGKKVSWRALGEYLGENFQVIHRVAQLLDLPAAMVKALESGEIKQNHGEALVQMRHWPEHQRQLFRDIVRHGWSGAKSEKEAAARIKVLQEKAPTEYSLVEEGIANAEARKNISAETQAEADNRRAAMVDVGTAATAATDNSAQTAVAQTASNQETRSSSPVAQLPKLPQQTYDQLYTAVSMMESAAVGLEQLDIAAHDFQKFQSLVDKVTRLAQRSKRAMSAKQPPKGKK